MYCPKSSKLQFVSIRRSLLRDFVAVVAKCPLGKSIALPMMGTIGLYFPNARRASRHIATANAEWRGARTKLENENLARARPVEAGKPGLSGLRCRFCELEPLPTDCFCTTQCLCRPRRRICRP